MKFNSTTYWISVFTMILYTIYIMSALGLVGLILSLAAALITAAFVDTFEIVTASVVIVGIVYVLFSRWIGIRGFYRKEGFSDSSEIIDIVDDMNQRNYGTDRTVTPNARRQRGPTGTLSTGIEGFADAGNSATDGAPATSTPAPAKDTAIKPVDDMQKKVENALIPEEKKQGFANANEAGLFKLGEMPSESADGPHVDAGTTLMKAMGSLQPDQIASMTSDTKSLLETQQNLMGMLKSMTPILKDGRKLLDSFSGIFGGEGGAGPFKMGGM